MLTRSAFRILSTSFASKQFKSVNAWTACSAAYSRQNRSSNKGNDTEEPTAAASPAVERPTIGWEVGLFTTRLKHNQQQQHQLQQRQQQQRQQQQEIPKAPTSETTASIQHRKPALTTSSGARAIVIMPFVKSFTKVRDVVPEMRLQEAVGLAEALDWTVVESRVVPLAEINSATFFGRGKLQTLLELVQQLQPEALFIDGFLTGSQHRVLEDFFYENGAPISIFDRYSLILEIFFERAATREAKLQIELASLQYQRRRLVQAHGSQYHSQHQRGATASVGGPGEKALQSERSAIDIRIAALRHELDEQLKTRELHREHRNKASFPIVAVVGYTNSGKSALVNALTGSTLESKNKMFASLETRLRSVSLPSGLRVGLTDTVGFISDLPVDLIAAFRSTLEDVINADLIIHLRDITSPEAEQQKRHVHQILRDLNISETQFLNHIEVWNKIDQWPDAATVKPVAILSPKAAHRVQMAVYKASGANRLTPTNEPISKVYNEEDVIDPKVILSVSALTGENCDLLLKKIDEMIMSIYRCKLYEIEFDSTSEPIKSFLYGSGAVQSLTVAGQGLPRDGSVSRARVVLSEKLIGQFRTRFQSGHSQRQHPQQQLEQHPVIPGLRSITVVNSNPAQVLYPELYALEGESEMTFVQS